MANDRLRTAMLAAGLSESDLARQVKVDPKTVERWISEDDRKPHRRTRERVANVLRTKVVDLWPTPTEDLSNGDEAELVHLYPSRSHIPGTTWERLIGGVQQQMDVLVFSGAFLVEQYNLIPIMQRKVHDGARFRLLIGDQHSSSVVQRATDEGTPGGLEGRIQLMRRYLAEVAGYDGVEVCTHDTVLYNSLYRFDDHLLVNGHAYGALAGQNPVMHLQRQDSGQIWQHYMRSFERVWNEATPESWQEN